MIDLGEIASVLKDRSPGQEERLAPIRMPMARRSGGNALEPKWEKLSADL